MAANESLSPGILEHTPPELTEVIASFNNGECTAVEAAASAIELGMLLIGCVRPQESHEPRPSHKYYDLAAREWRLVNDTEQAQLRATNVPEAAILCGLINDYNNPDERQSLGEEPLTPLPRPHFGWEPDGTQFHVRPGIVNAITARSWPPGSD